MRTVLITENLPSPDQERIAKIYHTGMNSFHDYLVDIGMLNQFNYYAGLENATMNTDVTEQPVQIPATSRARKQLASLILNEYSSKFSYYSYL